MLTKRRLLAIRVLGIHSDNCAVSNAPLTSRASPSGLKTIWSLKLVILGLPCTVTLGIASFTLMMLFLPLATVTQRCQGPQYDKFCRRHCDTQ